MALPYGDAYTRDINVLGLMLSATTGMLSGGYTARRVARMNPIEDLRHE